MSFLSQPITLQSLFGNQRVIGNITVDVIINEETNDTLTITKQPVQTGASITDHAYKEPTALSMTILQQNNDTISGLLTTFSGNSLKALYEQFLELQFSRVPFSILTPKRIYKSMLMSVIRQVTDKNTENILALNVSFQQVFIVSIGTATIPASRQKNAASNQATQNTGKQSALLTGVQALIPGTVGVTQ